MFVWTTFEVVALVGWDGYLENDCAECLIKLIFSSCWWLTCNKEWCRCWQKIQHSWLGHSFKECLYERQFSQTFNFRTTSFRPEMCIFKNCWHLFNECFSTLHNWHTKPSVTVGLTGLNFCLACRTLDLIGNRGLKLADWSILLEFEVLCSFWSKTSRVRKRFSKNELLCIWGQFLVKEPN